MSGTVSIPGLVSNTDWTSMITDVINAEKAAVITPLTDKKTNYQTKLSAWQAFNLTLSSIANYVTNNSLDTEDGYGLYKSALSCSDSSVTPGNVLSASLGAVTGPGSYSIEVTNLAQAEKISSGTFASKTTALGISGTMVLNGKAVSIEATDTLVGIAGKINNAAAGITASLFSPSGTENKLLLESTATGAAGMSIKNGSADNVLESLGLQTTTEELAHPSGVDALGDTFTSETQAIGTLLGIGSAENGTIQIKGTDGVWTPVSINLQTDSLDTIRDAINAAAPTGVVASVEDVTVNGSTAYQLKLTNTDINAFQDDKNVLETLGILKATTANQLRAGQDASLKIDGSTVKSSTNKVADVIQGVTLNLTGTNTGKPIDLTITQDNSQISQKVSALVGNINSAITYINDQNTLSTSSTTSSTTKPLFGSVELSIVKSTIANAVYGTVSGNVLYQTASSIGIGFQKDGTLSVDSNALTKALSNNSQEVTKVLQTLSASLRDNLNVYVDPLIGTFKYIETSINSSMTSIDDKVKDLNARFQRETDVMQQRYNALEVLIENSNLTKSWLTQQTSYMTGQTK